MHGSGEASVDVIVCVHNALEDVRLCLDSILNSDYPRDLLNLIIIDDGSDRDTAEYLARFEATHANVQLHRSGVASGYTKAANRGLRASSSDFVVTLNSDTIVPRKWLIKVIPVLTSNPYVGIVGPLSNAATWQSVPDVIAADGTFAVNALPEAVTVDAMDAIVEKAWAEIGIFPHTPILNGFCLVMKRAVFEKIGLFDEKSFPRGYGEENDFCFRASDAGFRLLVAANTYVFHAKSKSFGKVKRNELALAGSMAFKAKYPSHRIKLASDSMKNNPILARIRKSCAFAIERSRW